MIYTLSARLLIRRQPAWACSVSRSTKYFSTKSSDPLRILFCGSDGFSIASLKAINAERTQNPGIIESIDVVCRPGKPAGRGLKTIREVPIKAVAEKLSLPLHEIDTFTNWTPPSPNGEPINLIIAVSFGLFVPRRILEGAKYGGLNVHPSLLPEFRGPAPLHHTLLAGEKKTGITVQTLDTANFDHGLIIDQTPPPGFDIPDPDNCDISRLHSLVSQKGADMLANVIRNRIFVSPLNPITPQKPMNGDKLRHAGKIKPEDRHIRWSSWTWDEIRRRSIVLGPLWNTAPVFHDKLTEAQPEKRKRIIFGSMKLVDKLRKPSAVEVGVPFTLRRIIMGNEYQSLYIFTCDGKLVEIEEIKVEGQKMARAFPAALKAKFIENPPPDSSKYPTFYGPLE